MRIMWPLRRGRHLSQMHNPEHYADHTITTLCVSATDRKQWDFVFARVFISVHVLETKLDSLPGWRTERCGPLVAPCHHCVHMDWWIWTLQSWPSLQKNQGASRLNMDNTVLYNSHMSVVAVILLLKWWWGVWGGSQFLTSSVLLFMKRSLFSCLFCLRAFYFGINDA